MKKKYLIGIIIGIIAAVVIIGGSVILSLQNGTELVSTAKVSSFPKYKAGTSYLFGFSYKKSGVMPLHIKSIDLVDSQGNDIKSGDFDWTMLENNDNSVSVGALVYDESNMLIDYSALQDFKEQDVDGNGINLALKIDSKKEQDKPQNCFVKVEYSVMGRGKTLMEPLE